MPLNKLVHRIGFLDEEALRRAFLQQTNTDTQPIARFSGAKFNQSWHKGSAQGSTLGAHLAGEHVLSAKMLRI